MDEPKTKHFVDDFAAKRLFSDHLKESNMGKGIAELQELDKHINSFLEQIKQDSDEHNASALADHAKTFDKELHKEFNSLFFRLKTDIDLLHKALRSLSNYREELSKVLNDEKLKPLADSELNYANSLQEDAQNKIKTLEMLFRKLK